MSGPSGPSSEAPLNVTVMLLSKEGINHLHTSYLRGRTIMAIDMFLSLVASVLVITAVKVLVAEGWYSIGFLGMYLLLATVGSLLSFLILHTYRIIIRHLSVKDFIPFSRAFAGKSLFIFAVMAIMKGYFNFLLLLVVLDFFVSLVLVFGTRVLIIELYDIFRSRRRNGNHLERLLIYGTDDQSVAVFWRLHNSKRYAVCGFLKRQGDGEKMIIEQLPVFCFTSESQLGEILSKHSITGILYPREIEAKAEEHGVIQYCASHNIKSMIVPLVDELGNGQAILHPRNIKVEDLLGREEIVISLEEIMAEFKGKRVLVTGAAGSIGSELVRQIASFEVERLILYDNAETPLHNTILDLRENFPYLRFTAIVGDVRQVQRLDYAFRTYRPDVVFHAAAYKHVPLMEENPCEAVRVNVTGSRLVADKCLEYDVEKMVMISTDKAVNPTSVMGCTKRLAEIYVQSLGLAVAGGQKQGRTRFVTTRFGNVLGSNGSVIPLFRKQIAAGGPVTVTHPEINRFFMTIPEACHLVLEAATFSSGNEIFVFDMGDPVKIVDLARRMISLAGFTPDEEIKIKFTGLRPGEKLYEEVLSNEENTLSTSHERIRIAKVREYPYQDALRIAEELERISRDVDIQSALEIMQENVPEYKLDKSALRA